MQLVVAGTALTVSLRLECVAGRQCYGEVVVKRDECGESCLSQRSTLQRSQHGL